MIGSDRVRYSVYEANKIYLLNTDNNMPVKVKIISGATEQIVELDSLELRSIQL